MTPAPSPTLTTCLPNTSGTTNSSRVTPRQNVPVGSDPRTRPADGVVEDLLDTGEPVTVTPPHQDL